MSRILVVDDEPNIRLVYKEVLSEEGYEVLEAESARETFEILNQEPVDLVILDIKLRSESGLDVLQRMTKEFPDVPVVLCSAYVSFQNDYTSWLADSYIVKSSDTDELLREVNRVLIKRGKTR
ncbi:MAG TPA: response regulator [Thermodesulfobacteriota bacterium]|jgi:DNA-binding NtrC family response regulator|nr:response regulator [Thermodesulfobacteriota bacterium]